MTMKMEEPSKVPGINEVSSLNADCLAMVFQYLDYDELLRVSATCKLWNSIAMFAVKTLTHFSRIKCKEIRGVQEVSDETLIRILQRTNLHSLDISNGPWPQEYCRRPGFVISDCAIKAIMDYCPNLSKLVTSEVLFNKPLMQPFFAKLPNLTYLKMNDAELPEEVLETILVTSKSLEYLILKTPTLTYTTSKCFQYLPSSLKVLKLTYTSFAKEDVLENALRRCPKLETLDLSNIKLGEWRRIVFDKPMPSLRQLLVGCDGSYDPRTDLITLHFRDLLERLPCLEILDVTDNNLGSELNNLAKSCPNLWALHVNGCATPDGIGRVLFQLKSLNLTKLYLWNYSIGRRNPNTTFEDFQLATSCITGFKKLEKLDLGGSWVEWIDNEYVTNLITQLPLLDTLSISGCSNVNNGLFLLLEKEPAVIKRTIMLEIAVNRSGIDSASFNHLARPTIPNIITVVNEHIDTS